MDPAAFVPRTKEHHCKLVFRRCVSPLPATFLLFGVDLRTTKKFDTVVKGFKVLEASYEESQGKLAITEERLSTVNTALTALIAEMEAAEQLLHNRETVRQYNQRDNLC